MCRNANEQEGTPLIYICLPTEVKFIKYYQYLWFNTFTHCLHVALLRGRVVVIISGTGLGVSRRPLCRCLDEFKLLATWLVLIRKLYSLFFFFAGSPVVFFVDVVRST